MTAKIVNFLEKILFPLKIPSPDYLFFLV